MSNILCLRVPSGSVVGLCASGKYTKVLMDVDDHERVARCVSDNVPQSVALGSFAWLVGLPCVYRLSVVSRAVYSIERDVIRRVRDVPHRHPKVLLNEFSLVLC